MHARACARVFTQSKRHASSRPLTREALTLGELTALRTLPERDVDVKRKENENDDDDDRNDCGDEDNDKAKNHDRDDVVGAWRVRGKSRGDKCVPPNEH